MRTVPALLAALLLGSAQACPLPADARWQSLLARAACVAPSLAAEAQRQREAEGLTRERRASEGGAFQAVLSPAASWTRESGASSSTRSASAQLQWSRTLLDQGAGAASTRQARLLAEAQAALREDRRQALALQLAQRAIDGLAAEAQLANAEASLRELQASRELAAARERAGAGTRVDRLRAEARAAEAEATLQSARQELARARLAYAQDLDLPDAAWPSDLNEALAAPLAGGDSLDTRLARAAEQHPDALRRRARIEAQAAGRDAVRAEGQGRLTLQAAATQSLNRNAGAPTRKPLSGELLLSWSRSLGDGGAQNARNAQAEARWAAEQDEAEAAARERRLSAQQQQTRWQQAQALLPARERALEASLAALSAAQGRLQAGAGTLTELLDAQAQAASSRQQRDATRLDALDAQAQLLRTLGLF